MRLCIDVYMDYVVVEGQTLRRAVYIPRAVWMRWWERVARIAANPNSYD